MYLEAAIAVCCGCFGMASEQIENSNHSLM